jgi:hypothetical protein
MANENLFAQLLANVGGNLAGRGIGSLSNYLSQGLGQGVGQGVGQLSNYMNRGVNPLPSQTTTVNFQQPKQALNPTPQQQGFAWLHPGGGQQQQPSGGIADYLRGIQLAQPQTFAQGMQGAMNQMGSLLQGNANRETANRTAAMDYDARMAELGAKERLGMSAIGASLGQIPERYQTGQQRVPGVPMVAPGGRTIQGYTYEPTYGLRFAPANAGGTGGANSGTSSALSAQDQAGQNIYESILGSAGPGAFNRVGSSAYEFGSPGGTFGGATVPTAESIGGAETGVAATPGTVWGPQYAEEAAKRIAQVGNAAAPYAGGPGATGLAAQFQDYLRGAGAGLYGNLARAGEKGEATQTLESQVARTQLQNALQKLMAQIYGSQLGTSTDDQSIALRMQQLLA